MFYCIYVFNMTPGRVGPEILGVLDDLVKISINWGSKFFQNFWGPKANFSLGLAYDWPWFRGQKYKTIFNANWETCIFRKLKYVLCLINFM